MDNELKGAIDVLVKRIEAKTADLNNSKKIVNDLCREAGIEVIYADSELESSGTGTSLRPDEFYGKSPMAAAREFLEKRKQAATLEEIRDALYRGGFNFEAQKWPESSQTRNLSIGVSKNSKIFHRLPNGMIGLTSWYPNIKVKKSDADTDDGDDAGDEETSGGSDASTPDAGFVPKLTQEDVANAKSADQGN